MGVFYGQSVMYGYSFVLVVSLVAVLVVVTDAVDPDAVVGGGVVALAAVVCGVFVLKRTLPCFCFRRHFGTLSSTTRTTFGSAATSQFFHENRWC